MVLNLRTTLSTVTYKPFLMKYCKGSVIEYMYSVHYLRWSLRCMLARPELKVWFALSCAHFLASLGRAHLSVTTCNALNP
jgi:hypothetical protein